MTNNNYPALTPRQAEVYHLHKVKKLKHKEIGKKLGIKWQTSRTLYYRACRALEEMEATLESAKRGKQ
jgi:DNA-directed RNA polymerase specialized sigma24 family protein